jgi:gliding-associated putative ABC transporter substrate-binding component GldG
LIFFVYPDPRGSEENQSGKKMIFKMMKSAKISSTIILTIFIVIVVNILSENYSIRLDLTKNKEYTLSKATRVILKNIDKPVTVTAYFSKDLPAKIGNIPGNLKDMLIEYGNASGGMVVYKFVNPAGNEELEKEAVNNGVQPVMINVREKDQVKQQKAFMGVIVSMGDEKEKIPVLTPGAPMEYALSTAIKKLSATNKPSIALIQGHGEASINDLTQAAAELSVLYNVEPLLLTDTSEIPEKFKTIALIRPTDTINAVQLSKLDGFLARGGNILLALNRVAGNFSNASGTSVSVGMEDWIKKKGVTISDSFIIDASCGSVTVQQQQGGFIMSSQISFPYMPIISKFADNPITKGLGSVNLQFASPITFSGDSSKKFIPIAFTSDKSGTVKAPVYFDIQKNWQQSDFPMSGIVVAAILEGKLSGDRTSRIVLISNGDFAVGSSQRGVRLPPGNISLLVNSIDWLSDDTGLIELRTKEVTSRPLKQIPDGTRSFLKWFNFLTPIILIIIYGLIRAQINRNRRIKRMEINYE